MEFLDDYEFVEQYERVKRFLGRVEDQDRGSLDYDDDVYAFFVNCYHLKDWIKHDPKLSPEMRDSVEDYVNTHESLMICGDLANRSKHYVLDAENFGAKIVSKGVIIKVGGKDERPIGIDAGHKKLNALNIARTSVKDWNNFIIKNGLVKPE